MIIHRSALYYHTTVRLKSIIMFVGAQFSDDRSCMYYFKSSSHALDIFVIEDSGNTHVQPKVYTVTVVSIYVL